MSVPYQPILIYDCCSIVMGCTSNYGSTHIRNTINTKGVFQAMFADSIVGAHDEVAAAPHYRCGHICKKRQGNYDAGCCVCSGSSPPCSLCAPKMVASALRSNGVPATQAAEIQDQIIKDVLGNRFAVTDVVDNQEQF